MTHDADLHLSEKGMRGMNLAEKQAEVYGFLSAFLMPPRRMSVEEYTAWWDAERAPIIRSSGWTMEEAADAMKAIRSAANRPSPARSEPDPPTKPNRSESSRGSNV